MTTSKKKPDVERILGGLKDFQRKTVDYVFSRLYLDEDRVDRFLIADEVGLGKTLVARGVVARAIEQIWDEVDRIDVVYICANRSIARQNVNRLNVTGQREIAIATRMTLLPLHLHNLHGHKINFVSFTPGTSFDLRSSGGLARERALIYHILRDGWQLGNSSGPKNLLQGHMGRQHWKRFLERFPADEIDAGLARSYLKALKAARIRRKFNELADRFWYSRKNVPKEDQQDRFQLIGELRSLLARSCVDALEPDIVILDEFQRFKTLLHGEDEVAHLANAVFDYPNVKVILLSATPYKMYSTYDEEGDDHYSDFLRTVGFLFDSPGKTGAFEKDLASYRRALLDFEPSDGQRLLEIRQKIEEMLRKVIVRTERLSVTADRSGMVEEARSGTGTLTSGDLKAYAAFDKVARKLGVGETMEYWKSAPYLLNVMERDGYKVKKLLVSQAEKPSDPILASLCKDAKGCMISWNKIRRYAKLDAGNSKLRDLLTNKVESGGWKLLWIPPSMPYYEAVKRPYANPELKEYTKTLIFSSWMVAPKAIAMLTSYEAERRMVKGFDQSVDYTTERKRRPPLLRFAFSQGRPTGMSVFPLIYPCLALTSIIDPLETARDLSQDHSLPKSDRVRRAVKTQLEEVLSPVVKRYSKSSGQPDERWYWAALAMLDKEYCDGPVRKWLTAQEEPLTWPAMVRSVEGSDGNFSEHVAIFHDVFQNGLDLGRAPPDLADVLAKVALASPAVATLRAFLRVLKLKKPSASMDWLLAGAAKAAMGFRTLFNLPDSITLLRSLDRRDDTRYWETVLDYCVSGNLQAVMDEYVHILKEALGLIDTEPEVSVSQLADEIQAAVSIRTVNLDFDEIRAFKGRGEIRLDRHSMRCRFALRFGDARNEEEGFETRADQVRAAFNSPFRPFILASTSIGQEGLDFHQYCHEIYHWNLPSNPVDLEQREGRIHRYKGHVIRKNVAKAFPFISFEEGSLQLKDPWQLAFAMAKYARVQELNDLIPYWIYESEGGNKILRHIPALPLSREVERLEYLRNALVTYRMVLGQPRQQDLVEYLQQRFESGVDPEEFSKFRVDLSPR